MEKILSKKIVYLEYPCLIIVCEDIHSDVPRDPETHDVREYARITPETKLRGFFCKTINGIDMSLPEYDFAGDIQWGKYADCLTDEHRQSILNYSQHLAEKHSVDTKKAEEHKESVINLYMNHYKSN